jgi:hypothetical protein
VVDLGVEHEQKGHGVDWSEGKNNLARYVSVQNEKWPREDQNWPSFPIFRPKIIAQPQLNANVGKVC